MTDAPEITKAVRPKRKRPRRAAPPKPKAEAGAYAGMTATNCAAGCSAAGCVISGKAYCAHPRKGGLQGDDAGNAVAIGRLNDAKKMLARNDADQRFA